MKYILLLLLSGCSALPMDGSVLDTIKGRPVEGVPPACNCEVEVTCN